MQGFLDAPKFGTYNILEKWDNTKEICLAGLFHSIYGTRVYKISSIDFSKRKYIESIIGKRAEELVYLFCVTDRREDGNLIEKNQIILKDIIHNKEIHISKNDLYALTASTRSEYHNSPPLLRSTDIIMYSIGIGLLILYI